MGLAFTSSLAELLEEQRRKGELEALKQQEAAAAQQEPAATSPVLTPEVSTSGAQTAAPAGDSGAAPAPQDIAAYPAVMQRNSTGGLADNGRSTTGTGNFRQGIGHGMSAAAADVNQLEQNYVAAGRANAAPMQQPDMSLPVGVAAPGSNPAQELASMAPKAMDSPMAMPAGRQVAEESAVGGIGAALAKAGMVKPDVAAPAAPADPLAPKPKLTARQRAEAEIPAVDDMKGWQKVLLVMGAGLAGGLTKDASLGAKLAAMTPQNRRKRLVDERIKEIQEQDKLDLDTRQTEAQIRATEQGQVRADRQLGLTAKEQEFNQGLQLARLDLDVKRFKLDQDIRTMQAETARQVAADRAEYNRRIAQIREDALKAGKVLPAGAWFIHPETGQLITENPYQPQVTTSKDTETVIAPDGKTATVTKERTETKSRGKQDATRNAAAAADPARAGDVQAYGIYINNGGTYSIGAWRAAGRPSAGANRLGGN